MAKTNLATCNEVLLQSATFGVKMVSVVAGSDARRLFSTGFTSPTMLLKYFLFLKKSVPEDQIFTKIRVALLMVSRDRQAAPTLNHTLM